MVRNVKLYQYFFGSQRITLKKFVYAGFLFGLCFPSLSIIIDIFFHHLTFSISSVIQIHQINPIHYVVDTAPWVLSATAYIIGRAVQCIELQAREHIVASEKMFFNILQYNPDAVFLVRTNDFVIEHYNQMALRLCDIDTQTHQNIHSCEFFTSLNESLSILSKLRQDGDIFSSEMQCITVTGKIFWGQITMHAFALNDNCYQLIRIADITPAKQRELELEKIKYELQQYSEELQSANEEVTAINNNLEQMVKERTELLQFRNKQLTEYAFLNAHKLRGPLTRVLGSAYALEYANNDQQRQEFIEYIVRSSKELDQVIHRIAKAVAIADDDKDPIKIFKEEYLEDQHRIRR